jgi:mRNA-degrading endonuclease RelE of RelBE toxin-antitoxin system
MRQLEYTNRFKKLYKKLPTSVQTKLKRQLSLLVENEQHPSLNTKKMQGRDSIWEARVDRKNRFTFSLHDSRIILRAVGPHDILKEP